MSPCTYTYDTENNLEAFAEALSQLPPAPQLDLPPELVVYHR